MDSTVKVFVGNITSKIHQDCVEVNRMNIEEQLNSFKQRHPFNTFEDFDVYLLEMFKRSMGRGYIIISIDDAKLQYIFNHKLNILGLMFYLEELGFRVVFDKYNITIYLV